MGATCGFPGQTRKELEESEMCRCDPISMIYPRYEVALVRDQNLGVTDDGSQILGEFLPMDNAALIDKSLFETGDPRRVFTTCHEVLGHGVLHGPFLRENAKKYRRLLSTEASAGLIVGGFDFGRMNTFEWQANTFAVNVIAPLNYVWCLWIMLFGANREIRYCGPGRYCLSFAGASLFVCANSPFQLAWIIARKMQRFFWGLSAESLAYQVAAAVIDYHGYELGEKVAWHNAQTSDCAVADPVGV